jgi:hypothetical protein
MRLSSLVVVALLSALTPADASSAAPTDAMPAIAPRAGLSKAFEIAGENRAELEKALDAVPAEQRASMEWLIAHMPAQDLQSLDAAFLTQHVRGAHDAWKSAPWTAMVDEETFRDAILPYASVSEKRELWLPVLRAKCLPMIEGAKGPAEAAVLLNQRLFPAVKVQYSTKRRRADQAPSESMESGLASCTGLSILLVDACRAVGVPARFVGVPLWTDGSGNHSWVEVWDGARWRYTGAAEPSGDRLDEGWFSGRASGQNRDKPEHAIYAVTWRDSGVEFPMVFDPSRPRARAVDVTDRYAGKASAVPEGSRLLRVCVRDPRTGLRVACAVEVRDEGGARVLAAGRSKDERFDLNDHLELVVPKDAMQSFAVDGVMAQEVRFVSRDGEVVQAIVTRPESGSAVDSAPRSSPGAVAGEASDESLALMAEMMPAELIAAPVSGESEGAAAIRELQAFLKKGTVAEVAAQPFAGVSLTEDEAERVMRALRSRFEDEVRAAAKAEFESKVLEADGAKMPFWYAVYGDKPKSGRSLWISMHGGGGAPKQVNDGQWENQKKLYKPEEGVYVAPRAPTDTWNLWHQGHIDALFRKLITDMIVFEGVDPNRVYLMGYSAGGDGVYQLAPRMADSFAAAAMMAGHPNETRPDGLRNLPFALYMGGKDGAFNRNEIARQWKTTLADLAAKDAGGYPHEVTIFEENGHWMERKDAVAVPWMAKQTRNLRPTRIVWLQDDVTSTRFYWLGNPEPKGGQRVVATRSGQEIRIEEATDVAKLVIWLDDELVDLDKPVRVLQGERVLFEGRVPRTIGALAESLAARGDPSAAFPASVVVELGQKSRD